MDQLIDKEPLGQLLNSAMDETIDDEIIIEEHQSMEMDDGEEVEIQIVDEEGNLVEHDYAKGKDGSLNIVIPQKKIKGVEHSRKDSETLGDQDLFKVQHNMEILLKAHKTQYKDKIVKDEQNVDILNKQKIIIKRLRDDLSKAKRREIFLQKELANVRK